MPRGRHGDDDDVDDDGDDTTERDVVAALHPMRVEVQRVAAAGVRRAVLAPGASAEVWFGRGWVSVLKLDALSGQVTDIHVRGGLHLLPRLRSIESIEELFRCAKSPG
jgi:hypothetical protein